MRYVPPADLALLGRVKTGLLKLPVDRPVDLAVAKRQLQAYVQLLGRAPDPVKGGTFFYCPNPEEHHEGWADQRRFRTEKAYRRHWSRHHGRETGRDS